MAKINRSSKSGKFVTAKAAKKKPNTTVTETTRNTRAVKSKIQNALNIINNQVALIENYLSKV